MRNPFRVTHIPVVFGTNQRPTDELGLVGWMRVGGESINDSAFAMLSIPTTA